MMIISFIASSSVSDLSLTILYDVVKANASKIGFLDKIFYKTVDFIYIIDMEFSVRNSKNSVVN